MVPISKDDFLIYRRNLYKSISEVLESDSSKGLPAVERRTLSAESQSFPFYDGFESITFNLEVPSPLPPFHLNPLSSISN